MSMAEIDYKEAYYEAKSHLNELETRLTEAREKNIKLVKEYKKIEPLIEKIAEYNEYAVSRVSDAYKNKFQKYYNLMQDYATEWETYKNNNLFHNYTSQNFRPLKDYVEANLSEVTFGRDNTVYVHGEKLVK